MKPSNTDQVFDVIISGGGPVGLFLACELALAKCSVLLIEKAESASSPLKRLPFGIRGLSAPSIEALDRRGLLEQLEIHKRIKNPHAHSGRGVRRQVGHFAGIPFHEGDIDTSRWRCRLSSSTPTSLISEIEELESVFTQRALSLGVEIARGFAVSSAQQDEDGVLVQCGERTYRALYLVGCDGARSSVRKIGGFDFVGTEPEFTGYTTQVVIADPEKLKPGRNVTATGMYMQSQPGYVTIQDFDGGAFHSSGKPITRDHIQEVLRHVSNTDVTITELQIATTWTDRARQASTYRNGRILLAGDAAHIHSPLGGQGLNLGLGDAMNLGWKLAATIFRNAPGNLLDSYVTERHPIGAQVLDWSRAQVAIMRPGPAAKALNTVVRDLINTTDGATYFAGRVWGVHTKLFEGDDPLIGSSAPNFLFEDGRTLGELMRDGRGLLIEFGSRQSLMTVADEYRKQLTYISANVEDDLGLRSMLVRPDGIVAWTSTTEAAADGLIDAIQR